jgi:hypothetical protein
VSVYIKKPNYKQKQKAKKNKKNPKNKAKKHKQKQKGKTTEWTKKKGQPTIYKNTTQKTKDRAKRTPLKTGGEIRCSGRISSVCSTSYTHRVTQKIIC